MSAKSSTRKPFDYTTLNSANPSSGSGASSAGRGGLFDDVIDSGCGASRITLIPAQQYIQTPPPPVAPIVDGLFDRGDKVALLAKSKTNKTWFLMQLALSLSAGLHFAGLKVPGCFKALFVNFEIKPDHCHRRFYRIARSLNLEPGMVEGLHILNARGLGIGVTEIQEAAVQCDADVIVLDPLYKLMGGAENDSEFMALITQQFDSLVETTGAALVYSHHDTKGVAGDRDIRDRGAGHSTLSRDYDAALTLTPAADGEYIILDHLCRNYPPRNPVALSFENFIFQVDGTVQAVAETSLSRRQKQQRGPTLDDLASRAAEIINKPVKKSSAIVLIRDELHVGANRARDVLEKLEMSGTHETAITKHVYPERRLFGPIGITAKEACRLSDEVKK